MSKRIFITGGASGLGRSLAILCAVAGHRVCIADLNEERGAEVLQELNEVGAGACFLRVDVRQEDDLEQARAFLEQEWGGVDVVVNNAGVAQAGKIEQVPLEDWEWVIDINLLGVVRGCKVFTPLFKRQGGGHFVNVASAAGLLEGPEMTAYSATKAAVVKLSEILVVELGHYNIEISVICPAFFQTNLAESLRTTSPGIEKAMGKASARSPLSSDDVAGEVLAAIESPRFWVLPHRREKYLWWLKGWLPQPWYRALLIWLIKKMDPRSRKRNR